MSPGMWKRNNASDSLTWSHTSEQAMHEPEPNPNPYTNSNSSSSTSTSSCSCHKRSSIRNQAHIQIPPYSYVHVRACMQVSRCECLYKYSHNRICANHTYVHAPLCAYTAHSHTCITCSNFSRKFITFRNYSTFVCHTTPRCRCCCCFCCCCGRCLCLCSPELVCTCSRRRLPIGLHLQLRFLHMPLTDTHSHTHKYTSTSTFFCTSAFVTFDYYDNDNKKSNNNSHAVSVAFSNSLSFCALLNLATLKLALTA